MPLLSGYSQPVIAKNISTLMHEGRLRSQAVAIALKTARESWHRRHGYRTLPPMHLRSPIQRIRKNPVPASRHLRDIEQASRLYHKFTGHDAEEVGTIDKPPMPGVLVLVGTVDGILYTTVRDGVTEKYIHRFGKKARPLFCVSPDGSQLFMLGGAYNFTERGIVDDAA